VTDPELADALRHRLVAELTTSGVLQSAEWWAAFERVPRHVFVPRYFLDREHNGSYVTIDSANPAQRDEWLRAVYTDETLITQLNGDRTDAHSGVVSGIPTSSSTMPGLMALMLEALDVGEGMRVLEIGTGTGYNSALLCERLGSELVTSIDVDETLVASARKRLEGLGYVPALAAADGACGYPAKAPYDRTLATVALPHVPGL
jgi:protein-L-isoaspartate O-methyltransferase